MMLARTFSEASLEDKLALVRRIRAARELRKLPTLRKESTRRASSPKLPKIDTAEFRRLSHAERLAYLTNLMSSIED